MPSDNDVDNISEKVALYRNFPPYAILFRPRVEKSYLAHTFDAGKTITITI